MKNYLRFLSPVMLLLMAVMFGGGKILAQTSEKFDFVGWKFTTDSWGTNYAQHTVSGNVVDVVFSSANKQSSNASITDCPVTKGQPITVTLKDPNSYNITGVKLLLKQWKTNKQTVTLKVSANGKDFTPTSEKSPNFELNASSLTTKALQFTFSSTSNQVGVQSIEIFYEKENGKTQTTLSFSKSESSFTYDLNYNGSIAELVNPATLSPNVEGATISYTISESTFADGEISVEDGAVTFYTDKEASATITASYAGNDTYAASTASYTIKVVDPNSVVVFSDKNNSFANISKLSGGQGYKKGTINFVDGNGVGYSFSITNCMLDNQRLQMQKTSTNGGGILISPVFGYMYGYKIIVTYVSKDDMTLIAGDKTVTGTNGVLTLTTASDINFTLRTGKEVSYVTSIAITPNTAPETLTTSASGYATYSADYAVNYSELGLTAYTLTVDETNKTVTAKEFTGVVPAGKAVLVKGAESTTYTLTPATTEGDATFATDLKTGATTADGTQYGFTTKFGTPAFAQVASGQDIPAKKGYIVLTDASAAKYSICFGDETTGIQTIEAASAANAAMYNLAGQRVDKAYKGIVIVNGKKYLNK